MQTAYFLNPMAGIVTAYRALFLGAPPAPPLLTGMSLSVAWILLWAGWTLFHRVERQFAEVL
jgi:ABC-type polysaccharide/polyol phosphate export permease